MSQETTSTFPEKLAGVPKEAPYFPRKILGSTIDFQSYGSYSPEVLKEKQPVPSFLGAYLSRQEKLSGSNLEGVNHGRIDTFLASTLGKKNIDIITIGIKDAIQLAATIVGENIRYDREAADLIDRGVNTNDYSARYLSWSDGTIARRQHITDNLSADQLLIDQKQGICRNYTRLFIAVLEGLKRIQAKSGGSHLSNIYAITAGTYSHENIMLISVGPAGSIKLSAIDPTNMDYDLDKKIERIKPDPTGLIVSKDLTEKLISDFFSELNNGYKASGQKEADILSALSQLSNPSNLWKYQRREIIPVTLAVKEKTQKKLAALLKDTRTT